MLCDSFRRLLGTRRLAVGATCCEQAHRKRSSEAALDKGARHLDCQSFNMFGLASAAATDRLAVASGTLAGRDAPRILSTGTVGIGSAENAGVAFRVWWDAR